MTDLAFADRWRINLENGNYGVKLVDVYHPVEVYVGASEGGRALLQIRSRSRPYRPTLSDLVLVDRSERDSFWLLSLTLQDDRFQDVFLRLSTHLIERSRHAATESEGLRIIDTVFDRWRRLLQPRPAGRLTLEALRGLVGELWYLLEVAAADRTLQDAISGWSGPLGAPQDFWFADSGFHEIKTIGTTAREIRISSAEQLDEPEMELVVIVAEQISDITPDSVDLNYLVNRIKRTLDAAGCTHDDLDVRLRRMGVDIEDPYYAETKFTLRGFSSYRVSEEFPAIRASRMAAGVTHVHYELLRGSLEPFEQSNTLLAEKETQRHDH